MESETAKVLPTERAGQIGSEPDEIGDSGNHDLSSALSSPMTARILPALR
jgi:hypothetical protein